MEKNPFDRGEIRWARDIKEGLKEEKINWAGQTEEEEDVILGKA